MKRLVVVGCLLALALASACARKPASAPVGASTPSTGTLSSSATTSSAPAATATPVASTPAKAATGENAPTKVKPPVKAGPGQVAVPPLSEDRGKRFAYVKRVWRSGGRVYLELDYAEMLTGKAAADAAKAAGEESPPPNDYFIRNVNPQLRTFRLGAGAAVRYLVGGEPALHPATGANAFLLKWVQGAGKSIRTRPYWAWVDGDSVIRMEQVYLP